MRPSEIPGKQLAFTNLLRMYESGIDVPPGCGALIGNFTLLGTYLGLPKSQPIWPISTWLPWMATDREIL